MTIDELQDSTQLIYDVHLTMQAVMYVAILRGKNQLTADDARAFFTHFRDRMDDEMCGMIDEYCEKIGQGTWEKGTEFADRCEELYNTVAQYLQLGRAQLLQRVGEWRPPKREVQTINPLF